MYGERFYGDEVLFGLSEIIYFAGAAIRGDGVALGAPVLVNVIQALAAGDTGVTITALLTHGVAGTLVGQALAFGDGITRYPIAAAAVAGDGEITAPVAYLVLPSSGTAVGQGLLSSGTPVLWYTPLAQSVGVATVAGVPVIWTLPTANVLGESNAAALAVLQYMRTGSLAGDAVAASTPILVGVTTGAVAGDGQLSVPTGMLRLPTTGSATGETILTSASEILHSLVSASVQGDAVTHGSSILRDVRQAILAGDTTLPAATGILRYNPLALASGNAVVTNTATILWNTRTASVIGEGHIPDPGAIPVEILLPQGALTGDTAIPDLPFLLWDEDTGQIIGFGGHTSYVDTDGSTVRLLRIAPIIGGTIVTLDSEGQVIVGGSLFTLLDPSATGADRNNFSQSGSLV